MSKPIVPPEMTSERMRYLADWAADNVGTACTDEEHAILWAAHAEIERLTRMINTHSQQQRPQGPAGDHR